MENGKCQDQKLGGFVIRESVNEIRYRKEVIKLTPKEMGVLLMLLRYKGTTVSRGDILVKIWGDRYGNDQGLTQVISRLRKIFSLDRQLIINTIPKKGYLLIDHSRPGRFSNTRRLKATSVLMIATLVMLIGYLIVFRPIGVRIQFDQRQEQGI